MLEKAIVFLLKLRVKNYYSSKSFVYDLFNMSVSKKQKEIKLIFKLLEYYEKRANTAKR